MFKTKYQYKLFILTKYYAQPESKVKKLPKQKNRCRHNYGFTEVSATQA